MQAPISPKEMRFVRFYIKNLGNPGKAAKKAGYKGSAALLEQTGIRILDKPAVKAELAAQLNAARLDANMILQQIQDIATMNIADFININPQTGEPEWDLNRAQAAGKLGVIRGIKRTRYGLELEFYDKLSALKLLGQHEALFVTVSRTEEWKISAIRDIQNERVSYQDLVQVFDDPDLVAQLFLEAGVPIPQNAVLTAGSGVVDVEIEEDNSDNA
jgi:hypothetical protein